MVSQLHAQIVVNGVVVDAVTKKPLQGFNIYINNTSIGTFTDEDGKFKLTVPTREKIELIISHLVYEKKVLVVKAGESANLTIEMNVKLQSLKEVVIKGKKKPSASATRNWIELFSVNLIGNYKDVSSHCKIKNPEVLYFDYDKDTKALQVFARRPIVVENLALGYLIRVDLEDFIYNFKTNEVVFKYSVFYENLPIPKPKMALIKKKRKELYSGSNMHFMRALYSNNLDSSGFSVYKYTSITNLERERVYRKVLDKIEYMYANQTNPQINISRLFTNTDTAKYYSSVLEQDKIVSFDTVKLRITDFTKAHKDWTLLNFNSKDTLMINYKSLPPSKLKGIANFSEISDKSEQVKKYKEERTYYLNWKSYLVFFNTEGVNVQSNGYYSNFGLFVYGDMSDRRLAGLLPFDYEPTD